jgi:hypothetical protein
VRTAAPLVESSYHEAGHVVVCLLEADADLRFARASTTGRGTSRLANAGQLSARRAAQIAVAGRVSEEVFLNYGIREVPDNDGYLLRPALEHLMPVCAEQTIRDEVRVLLSANAPAVERVSALLRVNADSDVDCPQLRAAMHHSEERA